MAIRPRIPDAPSPRRRPAAKPVTNSSPVLGIPKGVNGMYASGTQPLRGLAPTRPELVEPGQGRYVLRYPNSPAPIQPRVPSSGGSGGIGSSATGGISAMGSSSGFGGFGAEAPVAPAMSQDEYLAQDAEFLGSQSEAEREYQNLLAQLTRQRGEFELDTNNTLRNMGWNQETGWNQNDRLTGYGQAYQNQLGDFAGRGMLDSSLYGGALNDLNRGFGRQRDDLQGALSQFISGQEQDKGRAEADKVAAITRAQRQAIARYAAQFGGI